MVRAVPGPSSTPLCRRMLAPTPQGTVRESGLAQTRGTLDTLPDHKKNVLRAWGLQFLAAEGEAGTTLRHRTGVGAGEPGTPLSALDAEMPGWGGAGPLTCRFGSGTKQRHSTLGHRLPPRGEELRCEGFRGSVLERGQ